MILIMRIYKPKHELVKLFFKGAFSDYLNYRYTLQLLTAWEMIHVQLLGAQISRKTNMFSSKKCVCSQDMNHTILAGT